MSARRPERSPGPAWSKALGWIVPFAVLIAGLAASVLAYHVERDRHDRELASRVALVDSDARDQLQGLVDAQVAAAQATAAAISLQPDLDRPTFVRFANRLRDQYSALLGIGYIRRVEAAQVGELTEFARDAGVDGFEVEDPAGRDELAVILYNEPATELRASWGTDLLRIPAAATALDRSVVEGTAWMTSQVVLAVDRSLPEPERPAGFVVYAPVFEPGRSTATPADRRAALVGWANLPFRAQDLLDRVRVPDGIVLSVRTGDTGDPIASTGDPGVMTANLPIRVGDGTWSLAVTATSTFGADVTDRAPAAFAITFGFTAVLALLAGLLANGSRRWSAAAERATADLARSERELRATIAGAPDLILVIDHDGTITSASERAVDLLGRNPDELVGDNADRLVPGWRQAGAAPSLASDDGVDDGPAVIAAGGARVPVEITLSPLVPDEPDGPVIAIIRDVTARRLQEADRALLSSIVRSTDDPVITTSADGTITSWNRGAQRVYGWTESEAVGRPLALLAGPGAEGEVDRILADVAAGVPVFQHPADHRHRDGRVIHASVTASQLPSRLGQTGGVSLLVRDVTADVRSRAALAAYAEELERSNRDLEDFASVASHDLSEPLRVVGGYVDLLRHRYGLGRPIDRAAIDYIDAASGGVERMRALIDGLLELSRLRSEENRLGPVDLGEVTAAAVSNLAAAIDEANATVDVGDLPTVWGDRLQLLQLMQNLISNGVRFRAEDRRPVLRVRADAQADGRWHISVADNGIGIAPEHHERIFGTFRRLHPSDRYPGSGIGLAVARRVANLHGSDLDVESAPGRGSTFSFTLLDARGGPDQGSLTDDLEPMTT